MRVLIVEDNAIVAEDLRVILTRMGHEVTADVATCAGAIEECQENTPEIVLMDIDLRGKCSGIDAARQIKETHRIPIVFLSAFSDTKTFNEAIAITPQGYLVKPVHARELDVALRFASALMEKPK